jgi:hypothetical protein
MVMKILSVLALLFAALVAVVFFVLNNFNG